MANPSIDSFLPVGWVKRWPSSPCCPATSGRERNLCGAKSPLRARGQNGSTVAAVLVLQVLAQIFLHVPKDPSPACRPLGIYHGPFSEASSVWLLNSKPGRDLSVCEVGSSGQGASARGRCCSEGQRIPWTGDGTDFASQGSAGRGLGHRRAEGCTGWRVCAVGWAHVTPGRSLSIPAGLGSPSLGTPEAGNRKSDVGLPCGPRRGETCATEGGTGGAG